MEQLSSYLWPRFLMAIVGSSVLLFFLSKFYKVKPEVLPYVRVPLLTDAERRFFFVLESALPAQCYLLTQVRLANLVTVKPGSGGFFWRSFSPIGMKCVDFVVVQRETMRPLLIVELDDSSHKRTDRQQRDKFVDQVLNTVGIPVLHWPTAQNYNRLAVASAIGENLKGNL